MKSEKIHNSVIFETFDRLLAATLASWSDSSSANVSVRTIAARAGCAASAIDYHFGNLEHLYAAAQQEALQQAEAWTKDRLDGLEWVRERPLDTSARAALMAGLIDDWCEGQRPLAMAMREACSAAPNGGIGGNGQAHGAWMALWRRFWTQFAAITGMEAHAAMLALYFDGEVSQHVLRWNRPLDRALTGETAQVLFAFVENHPLPRPQIRQAFRDLAAREFGVAEDGAEPDPLDRAAARILLQSGFAALTFRNVAREAGTTLGSTSYHYGSKSSLIRRAFEMLYRSNAGTAERLTGLAGNLRHAIVQVLVNDRQPILRAYDELILHISRDPEFIDLRGAIRGYHDPAAGWSVASMIGSDEPVSPALAAAYSSICRGIDHLALAVPAAEALQEGIAALAPFDRASCAE
jgi:AcrR family transcriptional regulator